MTPSAWLLLALMAVFLWAVFVFNSLVRARNGARAAWSQIDVQLKRRHDLIPNLVSTVEGYLRHERGTLEAVMNARNEAMRAAGDLLRRAAAENAVTRALGSVRAIVEGYPDLKAVTAVRDLMEQLTTAENRIAFARQHYNDSVMRLNTMVEQFPIRLVAAAGGFSRMEFFQMEDPPAAEREGRV